ncbi:hypothetical protein D3981_005075 [Escherichia coli]|nr:hypothetical protein [Escherichia coli]
MKFNLKSSPRHVQRLQNIANVISGIDGVSVYIHETIKGPYFDPALKRCVLPNGDYSDPEFVALIEGFICHEAGHGRYTDSQAWKEAINEVISSAPGFIRFDDKDNPEFQNVSQKNIAFLKARRFSGLMNLFDDIQMERHTGTDYVQAKSRLAETYALMVKAGRMTTDIKNSDNNPVNFIESYLLNTLRSTVLGQQGHKETLDPFFVYAKQILEPVLTEVDAIAHEAHSCTNTEQSISLAHKTLELIQRLRDKAKEQQQKEQEREDTQQDNSNSSDDDSSNADSEESSDGDQSSEDQPNEDSSSEGSTDDNRSEDDNAKGSEPTDGESDGEQSTEDISDADSNSSCDTESGEGTENGSESGKNSASESDSGSDEKSNFSSEQWEVIEKLLNDFLESEEVSRDYHEVLGAAIKQAAAQVSDEVKAEFGAAHWDVPDLLIDLNFYSEVLNLSHSVGGDLSVLQQARIRGQNKTRDRGVSFDSNRLMQSPMGVRDVFRAQSESKNRGHVGLVVVRDISCSMIDNERFLHAIKTDLALSLAMQSYPKMHVANIVYPYREETSEIIKTFDQDVEETISRFAFGFKGAHTPTGPALLSAVNLLLDCDFDRKIIFLITDGQPTRSECTVSEVIEIAKSNDIEIAGIGIKTDELIGFDNDTFVNVEDVTILTQEVSKLVYQILNN